jgi:hypothetical protein
MTFLFFIAMLASLKNNHNLPSMDYQTLVWWSCLKGIALFNLGLWIFTAVAAPNVSHNPSAQWHRLLSLIYTTVCAFRSFYPRVDLERVVMVDHWLSSIVLGRSSATLAELACAVQVGLFLWDVGDNHGLHWPRYVGVAIVPLIFIAQCCCWAGVLTLDHMWHASEESLWAICALLVAGVSVEMYYFEIASCWAAGLATMLCATLFYVTAVVDVPMYLRRASSLSSSSNKRKQFRSFSEGIRSATFDRMPTGTWDVWMHEVGWMTPYFSLAVWGSIGLVWLH